MNPSRNSASIPAAATQRPNPTIATPQPIASGGALQDRATEIFTYNTMVGLQGSQTPILYNGDMNWAEVTLTLDTAGPVVVGTRANIAPIFSGRGWPLTTDQPITFTIAKGTRLYIFSSAINRVKVQIAPTPWAEQITALLSGAVSELQMIRTGRK